MFLLAAHLAHASVITWTNPASGGWNTAANWNPNQVPGASDSAVITSNGVVVTLNGATTVAGITLGGNFNCGAGGPQLVMNNQTLTLTGPFVINACGQFTLDSGSLTGNTNAFITGAFNWTGGFLAGNLTLTAGGTLTLAGAGNLDLPGCTLTNNGTVTWSSGTLRGGGTAIYNYGLWNATGDQTWNNAYGGTTFNNLGTFRKSGGANPSYSLLTGGVIFNQAGGVLDVQTGSLVLQGGGNFTGGYTTTNSE